MKYKKYTSEGMNINDLVLTELGSMEGFIPFCLLNHHINVNGIIPPNTAYIVDTDLIVNVNNVSYLKSKNIQINTGDVQIPSPPSGLSVRQGGIGELILNWSDNSQSKYGFEVYRRRKGAVEFVRIAVTEIGVSNYTDINLGHGITYEYQVKIADFAGAVEFSNIAEGTAISADLQFFASKPQNISHSGVGEWRHENGVSYLFATSGKDKVSLISACDAGVSGVVDLSSSEWSSLVYACFKKATKLDLRLGSWINQANVTVSVENAIVFKDDLKAFLSHAKTVNNSENWGNRKLYIGVITTDPSEDAQLIADVEELESLGWTIQIVYEELLSFTVSEKTFVDTNGRVSQNSGADLWTKNEAVFTSGYIDKGEVVKVYHSDFARVVDVQISNIKMYDIDYSISCIESNMIIDLRGNSLNILLMMQKLISQGVSGAMIINCLDATHYNDSEITARKEAQAAVRELGIEVVYANYFEAYKRGRAGQNLYLADFYEGESYDIKINQSTDIKALRKITEGQTFIVNDNFENQGVGGMTDEEERVMHYYITDVDAVTKRAFGAETLYNPASLQRMTSLKDVFVNLKAVKVYNYGYGLRSTALEAYLNIVNSPLSLEELDLTYMRETNNIPFPLALFDNLKSLRFEHPPLGTTRDDVFIEENKGTIESMHLYESASIQGGDLSLNNYLKLRSLAMSRFTIDNLTIDNCTQLESVYWGAYARVNNSVSITNCPNLKTVSSHLTQFASLVNYRNSTDDIHIDFSGCSSIEVISIREGYHTNRNINRLTYTLDVATNNTLQEWTTNALHHDFSLLSNIQTVNLAVASSIIELADQKRVCNELLLSTTQQTNKVLRLCNNTSVECRADSALESLIDSMNASGWEVSYVDASGNLITR